MFFNEQEKTDNEIIKLTLKDGDVFSVVIKRYESKLRRYIRRITNIRDEEIDDLLQDIFISVFQNLNSFDQNLSFSSWIYRIAHNKTVNYWKKYKKELNNISIENNLFFVETIFNEDTLILNLEKQENNAELYSALDNLDYKYRDVLILKFIENKDYKEISDILQKPMGSVATLINRGKKQLKNEIEKLSLEKNGQ